MNIILFIHQDSSKKGASLINALDENFYGTKLTIVHTYKTLKAELKKKSAMAWKAIILLFVDSGSRLNQLTSLIDLLEDKRIILILPDESKETLSKASQFFPRFFTPISDSYSDLCSVMNKMINKQQENNK